MSVHPSNFPSTAPTALPLDVPGDKPSDKPSICPLQAPTGLLRLVPYIQYSDFPTHVPSVYSIIIPIDGTSRLPIFSY